MRFIFNYLFARPAPGIKMLPSQSQVIPALESEKEQDSFGLFENRVGLPELQRRI